MQTATVAKIATGIEWAFDPVAFAKDVSGFEALDPWQEQVLLSDSNRIILNNARQLGKSSCASLLALHECVYRPGSLVLLLSPSLRQSSELFQCLYQFYKRIAVDVPSRMESALRLSLRNESRIISLPGTEQTVRGYSNVSLLIVDEAARVEDSLLDAVRPMLAVSDGRLILLSTPFGRRGAFFRIWESGKDWLKIKVTADQCPRISKEFLRKERASMTTWAYKQEYLCSFQANESAVFNWEKVELASKRSFR